MNSVPHLSLAADEVALLLHALTAYALDPRYEASPKEDQHLLALIRKAARWARTYAAPAHEGA